MSEQQINETQNMQNNELPELPPIKVAFILDNMVVDILHTDERLASIFLSNPIIVDVTEPYNSSTIDMGWEYNPKTKEFIKPNAAIAQKVDKDGNIIK